MNRNRSKVTLLADIVTGVKPAQLVLIVDSLDCPARRLLKAFVKYALGDGQVHVMCCGRPPGEWEDAFAGSNVVTHDAWSDQRGWSQDGECIRDDACLHDYLKAKWTPGSTIVIDSLSTFLLAQGVTGVVRNLHSLMGLEGLKRVVCVLHGDGHSEETVAMLRHIASASLVLKCGSADPKCHTTYKAASGAVKTSVDNFTVSDSYELTVTPVTVAHKLKVEVQPEDPMASITTFKLTLGEREMEARKNLVLPYIKVGEQSGSQQSEAKIYYQPDDADDFDEDDPDDDLDL